MFPVVAKLLVLYSSFAVGWSGEPRVVTALDTSLCWYYNQSKCDTARATGRSVDIDVYCKIRIESCPSPSDAISVCVAHWSKLIAGPMNVSTAGIISMGCLPSSTDDVSLNCKASCNADTRHDTDRTTYACCCYDELCNRNVHLPKKLWEAVEAGKAGSLFGDAVRAGGFISAVCDQVVYAVAILIAYWIFASILVWHMWMKHYALWKGVEDVASLLPCEDNSQIEAEIGERLKKGQHADIHLSFKIQGIQTVAKVYSKDKREFWEREKDAFMVKGLSHANVVRFYGAGEIADGDNNKLVILTEFHRKGSIRDYIRYNTLSWVEMVKLSQTMMCGLAHLHEGIKLPNGDIKWMMAHRDITSSNVLIDSDYNAVLCDLAFADVYKDWKLPEETCQAGTYRYMSPEALSTKITLTKQSFLCMDIYAAALVMWELLTQCETCKPTDYKLPFEDEFSGERSDLQTLITLIVDKKTKPPLPESFSSNTETVLPFISIIDECWDSDPDARLTARCTELRLKTMLKEAQSFQVIDIGYLWKDEEEATSKVDVNQV